WCCAGTPRGCQCVSTRGEGGPGRGHGRNPRTPHFPDARGSRAVAEIFTRKHRARVRVRATVVASANRTEVRPGERGVFDGGARSALCPDTPLHFLPESKTAAISRNKVGERGPRAQSLRPRSRAASA